MKHAPLPLICLLMACSAGCGRVNPDVPKVDSGLALALTRDIAAIVPRYSGSSGVAQTASFIASKAQSFGAEVEVLKFIKDTPKGKMAFRNVVARVQGRDKRRFILIGSHYDAKWLPGYENFSGANDGASSSGLLLAMLSALQANKVLPPVNLRFVFFDGEECFLEYNSRDGLFGSRKYASLLCKLGEAKRCAAVIVLDMIGDRELEITLSADADRQLKAFFKDAAAATGVRYCEIKDSIIDDHTPFQKLGIPTIDIIDFNYGPGNSWWHSPEDRVDKLSPYSLKNIGDAVFSLIWENFR